MENFIFCCGAFSSTCFSCFNVFSFFIYLTLEKDEDAVSFGYLNFPVERKFKFCFFMAPDLQQYI